MLLPGLQLRQTSGLAMTPRMQQGIALLQRSNQEALEWLLQEAETNPLIEIEIADQTLDDSSDSSDEPHSIDDEFRSAEASPDIAEDSGEGDTGSASESGEHLREDNWLLEAPRDTLTHDEDSGGIIPDDEDSPFEQAAVSSLRDRLAEQLRQAALPDVELIIGFSLIGLLDEIGRIPDGIEDIAETLNIPVVQVEAVRTIMMGFTPVGCFARDLRECLAAQLQEKNRFDPAMDALLRHLPLIGSGELARLRRICGVDEEDFADMLGELRALDPKPGFDPQNTGQPAIPDVLVVRRPDGFGVELNADTLPRVRIDRTLARRLEDGDRQARHYGKERMAHANWLSAALEQRSRSILHVAREVVARQQAFLEQGISALCPLTLRDVANVTKLHESTVSRITATRFIGTPRGVLPLRAFFSTALPNDTGEAHSADAIRQRIREMIAAEALPDILSDDAITAKLQADGIEIMRRTVAKYREGQGIANSAQRRRHHKLRHTARD